jgi:hypothetical protein
MVEEVVARTAGGNEAQCGTRQAKNRAEADEPGSAPPIAGDEPAASDDRQPDPRPEGRRGHRIEKNAQGEQQGKAEGRVGGPPYSRVGSHGDPASGGRPGAGGASTGAAPSTETRRESRA